MLHLKDLFVHVPKGMARTKVDYNVCGITGAVRVRMILQTQPGNRQRYSTVPTLYRPGCPSSAVDNAFTYHRCDPSLIPLINSGCM